MSEMVARVAKAIAEREEQDDVFATYEELARAAIEAMRRPTETMAIAGRKHSLRPSLTWVAMIDAATQPPLTQDSEDER